LNLSGDKYAPLGSGAKVFIFGGTTEGRQLATELSDAGVPVILSVATEYGFAVASDYDAPSSVREVIWGRLSRPAMIELFKRQKIGSVVDATHPYAVSITESVKAATELCGITYLRLKRQEGWNESVLAGESVFVDSIQAAAETLQNLSEKVLITTGSKELEPFTHLDNFAERCYLRILPMADSLNKALTLGFRASNIICMQGPFSLDMNIATLRDCGAGYLVTKDSGEPGGFEQKITAAAACGVKTIVVSRPLAETGYSYSEIVEYFLGRRSGSSVASTISEATPTHTPALTYLPTPA